MGFPSLKLAVGLFQIELIERAPVRLTCFGDRFIDFRDSRGRGAYAAAIAVAMRIRWQSQQNVFSHKRDEIDSFRPGKFGMESELRDVNRMHETFQTGNAGHLDRLGEGAVRPKRAFGNTEVERIAERARADDTIFFQLWNRAFFFTLKMQTVG